MARCPTCGQPYPGSGSEELLAALRSRDQREVYQGQDGGWYLTYGGGPYPWASVETLIKRGLIRPKYSDAKAASFWLHPTIDVEKLLADRRALAEERRRKRRATKLKKQGPVTQEDAS